MNPYHAKSMILGALRTVRKMSNTPIDNIEIQILQQENCRFSYMINFEQPVRCSIIGDTPLFFMDHEEAFDEELEEFFDFSTIDSKVAGLEDRLLTYEESSFLEESETIALFLEDKENITKSHNESDSESLDQIIKTLQKSRLGDEYIKFAAQHNIELSYSKQIPCASYEKKAGTIFINPNVDETEQLLMLARELRFAWQHKNGALLHPLTFLPDQAVLVNRAQIADATTSMIRVAWELQLSGKREAWEYLEKSSYADLVHAFSREACLDFRALNNGEASSAAFESWFLSERCQFEDRKLIRLMLADYRGYVFSAEQSSRQVSADLIVALGGMPFGKNYLAPYVQTITTDPVFTEVRDRSNANFLWFIKFECSFRETEQELQNEEGDLRDSNSATGFNNKKWFDDNEEKENIIFLSKDRDNKLENRKQASSGTVVSFRKRRDD
jgi:hypothetical protein